MNQVPLPKHKVEQNKKYHEHKKQELEKDSRANPPMGGSVSKTFRTGAPKE